MFLFELEQHFFQIYAIGVKLAYITGLLLTSEVILIYPEKITLSMQKDFVTFLAKQCTCFYAEICSLPKCVWPILEKKYK